MQVPYRIHATFFCDIQKLNKQPSKGAESYFRHFYGRIEANCILFDLQVCGYNLPAIHGAYPGYQVNNIHVYTIMFVLFVSYIFDCFIHWCLLKFSELSTLLRTGPVDYLGQVQVEQFLTIRW